MRSKNIDILNLIDRHKREGAAGLNNFTMVLNGVIDAAVSGGVDNYRKVFFSDDFIRANPGAVFLQSYVV